MSVHFSSPASSEPTSLTTPTVSQGNLQLDEPIKIPERIKKTMISLADARVHKSSIPSRRFSKRLQEKRMKAIVKKYQLMVKKDKLIRQQTRVQNRNNQTNPNGTPRTLF